MSLLIRSVFPKVKLGVRNVSRSKVFFEKAPSPAGSSASSNPMDALKMGVKHRPNNLEKRFLVWSGHFKSIAEVPELVSKEMMEKARNKARIRISNYMMLATAVGCIGMIISGKRAAEKGESIQKMNLDWHKQVNKEATDAVK